MSLWAIWQALDIRNSDVVAPPYGWGGALAGALHHNNTVTFADIEADTLTLSPESARNNVTTRSQAILSIDADGVPADAAKLRALADDKGIWHIADAADSFGAEREGLPASGAADAIVLSFGPGKPLDAGEGGAVLTDDDDFYQRLVWLTQHPERHRVDLGLGVGNEFGLNLRIHPASAALAVEEFDNALARVRERRLRQSFLIEALNQTGLTQPIAFAEHVIKPSCFRLTAAWSDRPAPDQLTSSLAREGFRVRLGPTGLPLLCRQPAMDGRIGREPSCPVAEHEAQRRFEIHNDDLACVLGNLA